MTTALRPQLTGQPVLETDRPVLRAPVTADWLAFRDCRLSARAETQRDTAALQAIARPHGGSLGGGIALHQRPVWLGVGAISHVGGAAA